MRKVCEILKKTARTILVTIEIHAIIIEGFCRTETLIVNETNKIFTNIRHESENHYFT